MKILLEIHEIEEMLQEQIQANNLLGLANTDYVVTCDTTPEGDIVAIIETAINADSETSTKSSTQEERKTTQRRKRRTKAEMEAARQAEQQAEEQVEEQQEETVDDEPPFTVTNETESETVEEDSNEDETVAKTEEPVKAESMFAAYLTKSADAPSTNLFDNTVTSESKSLFV